MKWQYSCNHSVLSDLRPRHYRLIIKTKELKGKTRQSSGAHVTLLTQNNLNTKEFLKAKINHSETPAKNVFWYFRLIWFVTELPVTWPVYSVMIFLNLLLFCLLLSVDASSFKSWNRTCLWMWFACKPVSHQIVATNILLLVSLVSCFQWF